MIDEEHGELALSLGLQFAARDEFEAAPRKSCVAWEMFTWPTAPDDSMRAAVFTVSPQTSYWNFLLPTMPATTGPVCTPMRMPR